MMNEPDHVIELRSELKQARQQIKGTLRRAEKAEAERDAWRGAFEAAESILWMAEEYAEGGGSHGVEMEDYRRAMEQIATLAGKIKR